MWFIINNSRHVVGSNFFAVVNNAGVNTLLMNKSKTIQTTNESRYEIFE